MAAGRARTFAHTFAALVVLAAPDAETFELQEVDRFHFDRAVAAPGGERIVELYLRVETVAGKPVQELRPVDLLIRDGATPVDPGDVVLERVSEAGQGVACVLVHPFEGGRVAVYENEIPALDCLNETEQVPAVGVGTEVVPLNVFEPDFDRLAARSAC